MAEQCNIFGSEGFHCLLWLGHQGACDFDTDGNPLLTNEDRAIAVLRRLWENRSTGTEYTWASRYVLECVLPVWENRITGPMYAWTNQDVWSCVIPSYRRRSFDSLLGTLIHLSSFDLESVDWLIVRYDYERDLYQLQRIAGGAHQPASMQFKAGNSPGLGRRSELNGREPMISTSDSRQVTAVNG